MNDQFLKVAKQAALEAEKTIKKYYGKQHQLSYKEGDSSDFATLADLDAEKLIVKIINSHFPDHNIIGEEGSKMNRGSKYTWVIDPIDGTISFVSGVPNFAILIGLLEDNQPILGVIYHILVKDFYWAQKNQGAFLNGKKIRVSSKNQLADSVLALDCGHKKRRQQRLDDYILPIINRISFNYSLGSGAVEFGLVAKGVLDGRVSQAWIWDFVAGAVIVREAGGKVTDFEGNEPDWSQERLNIVASNGLIHNQILEALEI